MQARSFASKMHNDGTFQYFVADFGKSQSAMHGSEVFLQAVYINDCVAQIFKLYEEMSMQGMNLSLNCCFGDVLIVRSTFACHSIGTFRWWNGCSNSTTAQQSYSLLSQFDCDAQ